MSVRRARYAMKRATTRAYYFATFAIEDGTWIACSRHWRRPLKGNGIALSVHSYPSRNTFTSCPHLMFRLNSTQSFTLQSIKDRPQAFILSVLHLLPRLPTPTNHKHEPRLVARTRVRRSSRMNQRSSLHSLGGNAVQKATVRARKG